MKSGQSARSLLIVVVGLVGLAGSPGCDRKASPAPAPAGSGAAPTKAAPTTRTATGDPWAGDEVPPEVVFAAAKDGMQYLAERAAESRSDRDQQVAKLDRQIAKIQQLLEAGKYDEAEIRLVDIHWIPIEPGTHGEQEMVQQYDDKRAALTAFLSRKRQGKP